ncbi:carboxymuconolactone decarboxylase family protein [Agromyces sp. LHK192]|uniref:carboxymuconolactone decarboxylase family protein n=1 Tax=Agromyces sp. LHK192 TaxID=2498704 RepID=UPI000FDA1FFA|nr:carboxymuconolactone decarboxylase family protein [Agromyces sp. LHK192]
MTTDQTTERTAGPTTASRVPPTELNGLFGMIVRSAARRMVGNVPDSIGVLAHNRRLMMASMTIGRKVEALDDLDKDLASYATMATAAFVGCSWCLDYHYFKSHHEGLDEAKARQVPMWRESDAFTPLERNVMEYAEAMSTTPITVTDELSAAILDEIGPTALLELTARIAFMNMSGRMNISLGIHSDGYADACGLPPIATRAGEAPAGTVPVGSAPVGPAPVVGSAA